MYGRKRGPDGDGGFNKRKTGGGEIVKMLCPEIMTGSVIGKGGEEIRALQEKSGANIDVSKNGQNFPGTNERVITIKADKDGMFEVITFVHDKMKDHAKVHDGRKSKLKLLIADTSAGRIIGKGGETVKRLRSDWSVDVRPSVRGETPEDLDERILHIDGEWDNVMGCVDEVLQLIVDDRQAIMQKDVDYSQWCDFEPSERSNDRGRGGRGGFDRGGRGGRGGFRGASRDRGSPYSRGGPPRGRGGPPRGRPYSAAPIDDYSADPYGEDPYGGPPARGGPPRSRYSHGGPPHADDYEYDEPSFDAPPPRGGYSRGGPPRGGPPRRGSYPPVPRAKSYDAGPVDDGYYGAPPAADRFSGYGKPQEEYHDSFDQYNRKNRW